MVQADLDGDGVREVIGGRGTVVFVDSTESLRTSSAELPDEALVRFAADMDGDGAMDLLAQDPAHRVLVLRGLNDGTFEEYRTHDLGTPELWGHALFAADFDGDGLDDLALLYESGTRLKIAMSTEAGEIVEVDDRGLSACADLVTGGDLDSDGHVDLVMGGACELVAQVFFGGPDGLFEPEVQFEVGMNATGTPMSLPPTSDFGPAVYTGSFGIPEDMNGAVALLWATADRTIEGMGHETGFAATAVAVGDLLDDGHGEVAAVVAGDAGDFIEVICDRGEVDFEACARVEVDGAPLGVVFTDVDRMCGDDLAYVTARDPSVLQVRVVD
jgi:hypothetical protein